uniref:XK-related protein n=1 Tax=Branchiostoma floridae TaxID=7739 RepID=C3YB08_BRAFL|eukprot:XP_002606460.1 hypothetical protein BRAFLDRAFT_93251 [Branchiostoma floridae]
MDMTAEDTMDGVVTPQAPTRVWNRLLSVWHSKPVQIQLLRITLILYMTGLVMDIVLATRYYYSGDFHWFGWTLGFMLAPSIVMSVRSGLGIETVENNVSRCDSFLLYILQLAMPLRYFDILQMLSSDNRQVDDSRMLRLCHAHLVIAMLKGMPQLILKIYIIGSSQEEVTVLEVISMVISLLAAAKAAVTFMYYDRGHDNDVQSNHQFVIVLIIWKIVELSVRALIIGLCLSAVIQIPIVVIGLHWLAMVFSLKFTIEDYKDVIEGGLYLAIGKLSDSDSLSIMAKSENHPWYI